MSSTLRAAVAQFPANNSIDHNLEHIRDLVSQAKSRDVELLILPEASMCSFISDLAELKLIAKNDTPSFIQNMQTLAKENAMYIVVGVLKDSDSIDDIRIGNHLLVINSNGEIIVDYAKIHVYDAFSFKESDKVKPADIKDDGSHLGVFSIKDFTIGLINCYDLRFPELARSLIDRGVNVLSVSANWVAGAHKEAHWEVLLRARAIENTSYVLASGQSPRKGVGNSMIIDPLGFIIAGCGEAVGLQVSDLRIARINEVRETIPCLKNRRIS